MNADADVIMAMVVMNLLRVLLLKRCDGCEVGEFFIVKL
jgi:hypothetical protein